MPDESQKPLPNPAAPGGCCPAAPAAARLPSLRELNQLVNGMQSAEAAALLDGVDLDAETNPDLLYIAGVAFGVVGQLSRAVDLVRRAAAQGYDPFWCAFHLGQFEIGLGDRVSAAYHLAIALIAKPERDDIRPLLSQAAGEVNFSVIAEARPGTPRLAASRGAFAFGTAALEAGNPAASACYFAVSLACDGTNDAARCQLLDLAPGLALIALDGTDAAERGAEIRRQLRRPGYLPLHEFGFVSVLDQLRDREPDRVAAVEFGRPDEGPAVEVAARQEILYLPELQLQIWRDRHFPLEANADPGAPGEIQGLIDGGSALAAARPTEAEEITSDVCILSNVYSHYFHHMLEELYKVTILERIGFSGQYVFTRLPSPVSARLPSFSEQFLAALRIDRGRISYCDRPTRFRSAWLTTRISHYDTHLYKGVFFALRDALIAGAAPPDIAPGPRLWLDRRGLLRTVVNRDEVNERLGRYGFAVLDMAEFPIAQQIAIASRAEILGGPHGSALVHAMFLPSRSTVIECFSPLYINPPVIQMCLNLHHRYFQIVAPHSGNHPYQHGADVHVDLLQLDLALQAACEQPRSPVRLR